MLLYPGNATHPLDRCYPKVKGAACAIPREPSHSPESGESVGMSEEEFFAGDSRGGYTLPTTPYLWLIKRSSGLIKGSTIVEEVAAENSLSLDQVRGALLDLTAWGLIELLPTPIYSTITRRENISQGETNNQARLSIERSLITYRSVDGGASEWGARASQTISIVGDNRIARNLLPLLISSGFIRSSLLTSASDPVLLGARDINGLSVTLEHLGKSKALHHRELIRHSHISTTTQPVTSRKSDLVIATTPPQPDQIQEWQSEGIAHIAVSEPIRTEIEISYFIQPGATPCLRCISLHRRDALPPKLSALSIPTGGVELPATAAALIAALLASEVENFYQANRPVSRSSRVINLLEPTHHLEDRKWNFHPECGCVDVQRRASPR